MGKQRENNRGLFSRHFLGSLLLGLVSGGGEGWGGGFRTGSPLVPGGWGPNRGCEVVVVCVGTAFARHLFLYFVL